MAARSSSAFLVSSYFSIKENPLSLPPLLEKPESGNTGIWRIGTSGWNYPLRSGPGAWTGIFYPRHKVDELSFYSRYFNTVEINSTFYRPCSPAAAEGWAKRTPDSFEFTVKVWQHFTHEKEGWEPADIELFQQGIAPLRHAGKLGCLLFQFPTSFHCTDTNRDRLRHLLDAFGDYARAVELRHRSWDDNLDVLEDAGSIPVFIDEPKFRDSTHQTLHAAGSLLYVRFHGRQADKWWHHEHRNERYDYLYSIEEVRPYAVRLKKVVQDKPIEKAYVLFNNHPGAKSVVNAVMMRSALGIPVEEELPSTLVETYPELKEVEM